MSKNNYKGFLIILSIIIFQNVHGQTNTFQSSGNVGIGTTSPSALLDLNGSARITGNIQFSPITHFRLGGGSTGSIHKLEIMASANRDEFIRLRSGGNTPAGIAGIQFSAYDSHSWFTYANPGGNLFFSYSSGNPSTKGAYGNARMVLTNSGNLGIGISNPTEKLEVNGTIKTKEVNVTLSGWPDYVFGPKYDLMPLEDLRHFVEQNHHLPGIPSEEEIVQNGLNLGEMQAKLLEKIEELTLYIIQLKAENEEIRAELKKLAERN